MRRVTRIVIVDDHEITRRGLRSILATAEWIDLVIAEALAKNE